MPRLTLAELHAIAEALGHRMAGEIEENEDAYPDYEDYESAHAKIGAMIDRRNLRRRTSV